MPVAKGKRPRDPNQLAKWLVERSTSDAPAEEPKPETPVSAPANLSEYMAAIGRKGGQIGGKRRHMFYNYCRPHQTIRCTPAMEAGLADHLWTLEELCRLIPKPTVSVPRIESRLVTEALGRD